MELSTLPPEVTFQYALDLPLRDILHLCSTNKQFSELCVDEHFWKMKFVHDYHFTPDYTGSWRKLYGNYNSLWSFGNNHSGQLGVGFIGGKSRPTLVPRLKAKAISAGENHTVVIDLDDNVWTFGNNKHKQLGLGNIMETFVPIRVPGSESSSGARLSLKAKAISAGGFHTVVIDLDDNVWTFGTNDDGQLGLGLNHGLDKLPPTRLPEFKARAISAGRFHTVMIDMEDNVWSFGSNIDGRLGLGDGRNRFTPERISWLKAKAISAGEYHTVVIDLDDNVWSFGSGYSGQLGLGNTQSRSTPTQIGFKAKSISAGGSHTVVIDLDDNVWTFGSNEYGQLGLGDTRNRSSPTQIGFKAKVISTGALHTMLIDLEDNVWSFGWNFRGQLGLGDTQDRSIPTLIPGLKAKAVSAGESHTAVIATLVTS